GPVRFVATRCSNVVHLGRVHSHPSHSRHRDRAHPSQRETHSGLGTAAEWEGLNERFWPSLQPVYYETLQYEVQHELGSNRRQLETAERQSTTEVGQVHG